MAELTGRVPAGVYFMRDAETITRTLQSEIASLRDLIACLEERGVIGAKEYGYCQCRLRETVRQLRRLGRLLCED